MNFYTLPFVWLCCTNRGLRLLGRVMVRASPSLSSTKPSTGRPTTSPSSNEGSSLLWLDKTMSWHAPATGKRGRQPTFSDAAIGQVLHGCTARGQPGQQHAEANPSLQQISASKTAVSVT
ncbi:transposase [Aquitalea magnusonii]|uniref:Transposase n=1 Tax=Aquitalea aquatica TaxID=3044273 RepID=A0A838Y9L4_9NEIS|nr:transposase [Aquitalea magnusonii]